MPMPSKFHGEHRHRGACRCRNPQARRRPIRSRVVTDFDGKTAIVTGAASGIGRATAKALADAGATVTLLDVQRRARPGRGDEAGGTYVHLDVSDPDAWNELLGGVRPARPASTSTRGSTTPRSPTSRRSPIDRYRAYLGRERRRRVLRPAERDPAARADPAARWWSRRRWRGWCRCRPTPRTR